MNNVGSKMLGVLQSQLPPNSEIVQIVSKDNNESMLIANVNGTKTPFVLPKVNLTELYKNRNEFVLAKDGELYADVIERAAKKLNLELIKDIDFHVSGGIAFNGDSAFTLNVKILSDSLMYSGDLNIDIVNSEALVFSKENVTPDITDLQVMVNLTRNVLELEAPPVPSTPLTGTILTNIKENLRSYSVIISEALESEFNNATIIKLDNDGISDVAFFNIGDKICYFRYKVKA